MYVSGDGLNVRYCAGSDCCIADRLQINDPVSVMEEEGGWARISVYHDATITRRECRKPEEGLIAHWVSRDFLTTQVPDGTDPNAWFGMLSDRRIRGIPRVGDYGLTRKDLQLIRRYASSLLLDGTCEGIATGNKSVSREGTYYVACEGETEQRYFTAEDVSS
jgi:hypothetical protein